MISSITIGVMLAVYRPACLMQFLIFLIRDVDTMWLVFEVGPIPIHADILKLSVPATRVSNLA